MKRLFNLFLAITLIFPLLVYKSMLQMEPAGLVILMVVAGTWETPPAMVVGILEMKAFG